MFRGPKQNSKPGHYPQDRYWPHDYHWRRYCNWDDRYWDDDRYYVQEPIRNAGPSGPSGPRPAKMEESYCDWYITMAYQQGYKDGFKAGLDYAKQEESDTVIPETTETKAETK